MAQPQGFVYSERRADKCRLLLTIYTLLHTPAHVRVMHNCTRPIAPLVHFALPPPSIHLSCCGLTLANVRAHTHTGDCVQCISVNQWKRERWEKPLRARHSDRSLAPISPHDCPPCENPAAEKKREMKRMRSIERKGRGNLKLCGLQKQSCALFKELLRTHRDPILI